MTTQTVEEGLAVEEGDSCWDTERSAAYINSTQATMQTWRSRGVGPAFYKGLGRKVLYRRSDLDRFIASRRVEARLPPVVLTMQAD